MSQNYWNFLNQELNIKDKSLIMIKLIFGKCWNSLETNEPKPTLGVRFLKPKKQFTLLPKNTLNVDYSLKCKETSFTTLSQKGRHFNLANWNLRSKQDIWKMFSTFQAFLFIYLSLGQEKFETSTDVLYVW